MTIELQGVTVRYGDHVAVRDLTATFPRGTVGLLGRNGAGKSSILKAMLGLVRPVAGRILVHDLAPGGDLRSRVGYMPERDAHLPNATGFEMITVLGQLSGMARRDAWRRAHEVLYLVGLEEQRYRSVAGYSAGMRQKVKLAAALVHDPVILFLDEPTNGLDPRARLDMLELVRRLGTEFGKSVLLSTHVLQDVEAICDSVVVMEAGRIVAAGEVRALTRAAVRELLLVVEPATTRLPAEPATGITLTPLDGAGSGRYSVRLDPAADPSPVFAAVRSVGARVRSLAAQRRTLTEVFVAAVGAETPEPGR
ncbi:MAG: ABC transporter ATP-binding protein [Planctomycetes bacterium]|nr:ABC transporter ATP-binding protein [Planctomycetota bacterium]